MSQKVKFPEYGNSTVEFPDEMGKDEIQKAIESEVIPQLKEKFGSVEGDSLAGDNSILGGPVTQETRTQGKEDYQERSKTLKHKYETAKRELSAEMSQDKLRSNTMLKGSNIPAPGEMWESIKATPEVADRLAVGALSFFPSMGAKMGRSVYGASAGESPEQTEKAAEKWAMNTQQFINIALHPFSAPEDLDKMSDSAKKTMHLVEQGIELPREYFAEPIGYAYEKLTGDKTAGNIMSDSMEVVFWVAGLPKLTKAAKKGGKRLARELPKEEGGQSWKGYQDSLRLGKEERLLEEAKAQEAGGAFETYEAMSRTAKEQAHLERLEAAEKVRSRELEARQKMYEDLFTDKKVKEFVDDVEAYAERKAQGKEGKVTRGEVELLYDRWLERQREKKGQEGLELRKDWENWQIEKAKLESEGVKPAADLFRREFIESGVEGKGLPPGMSDLKFGVEAGRPHPEIRTGESLIKQVKEPYVRQKERLGYKKDYSLARKMKPTGKRTKGKILTKEEVRSLETPEAAGKGETQFNELQKLANEVTRESSSEVLNSVRERKPLEVKSPDYQPPVSRADAQIAMDKMDFREKMLKDAYERRQRAKEKSAKEAEEVSLQDVEAAENLRDFFDEPLEPQGSTPFRKSLEMDASRDLVDIISDMGKLSGDERGSISLRELSAEQARTVERLTTDIAVIKRNAQKAGLLVADYLTQLGFTRDPKIAKLIEERADKIVEPADPVKEMVLREGGRSGVRDAQKVRSMYERNRKAEADAKIKRRRNLGDVGEKVWAVDAKFRKWIETIEDPKALEVQNRKINYAGTPGKANYYLGKAYNRIFSHLTSRKKQLLDEYINAVTEVDIAHRNKGRTHQENISTGEMANFLRHFKDAHKLDSSTMREIKAAADQYYSVTQDLLTMKWQNDALPTWLYELLSDNKYSPSQMLEYMDSARYLSEKGGELGVKKLPKDPEQLTKLARKEASKSHQFDIKDNKVKRIKGGSKGYRKLNTEELLAELVFETHNWVAKNQLTKSLGELAQSVNNEVLQPAKVKSTRASKHGDVHVSYEKPPEGMKQMYYFKNGERVAFNAADWLAHEWRASSPEVSYELSSFARKAMMAGVTREMATGAGNPLFFLKGLPMDFVTIYLNAMKRGENGKYTSVYSSQLPVYTGQFLRDAATVAPDIFLRKGRYLKSMEDGLSMPWITEGATRLKPKEARRGVKRIYDGLSAVRSWLTYLNTTQELIGRHVVRERMLRDGHPREAATAAARDYLDFAQGGSFSKAVDSVAPYTNVGIQALRTTMRSAKRNPKEFATKLGWLAAFEVGMEMLGRHRDPAAMKQESDYNRNNYNIIPTKRVIKDEFGNKHHVNLKIRKEPALTPFLTAVDMSVAAAMGDRAEFDRLGKSLKDALGSINPTSQMPPAMAAVVAYATNTDMMTLEKLSHKKGRVEAEKEFDKNTNMLWRQVGEATGMSPDRLRGAVQQVFGRGNGFTKLVGAEYDELFDNLPEEDQQSFAANFLIEGYGNSLISLSTEAGEYYEFMDEASKKAMGKRVGPAVQLDRLCKSYYIDESIPIEKVYSFIQSQPNELKEYLFNRFERYSKTAHLPNRQMWQMIGNVSSGEAKAQALLKWENTSSPEKKQQIQEELGYVSRHTDIVPQDGDADFWKWYGKLKYQDNE